jgi:hypothetical protein
MGIANIFGFGKKEEKKKTPFRIPAEASAISTIIEAENRENYPKLDRYQEIVNGVKDVFTQLDAIIAKGEHAEEAIRIKEDIRKKMGQLTEKINKNKEAAKKEYNQDYIENNMEYLERKSMRNQAKTLFAECLDAIESIMKCCKEERLKNGTTMESATDELIRAMSALNNSYFKKHVEDKEIKNMREELLKKIEGLNNYFEKNRDRIKEQGLEERARSVIAEIARATDYLKYEMRGPGSRRET